MIQQGHSDRELGSIQVPTLRLLSAIAAMLKFLTTESVDATNVAMMIHNTHLARSDLGVRDMYEQEVNGVWRSSKRMPWSGQS